MKIQVVKVYLELSGTAELPDGGRVLGNTQVEKLMDGNEVVGTRRYIEVQVPVQEEEVVKKRK